MFNHPTSRPQQASHASAAPNDSYAYSPQPWTRFDLPPSSVDSPHSHHADLDPFGPGSAMEWTSTAAEVPSGYHHVANDVPLSSLSPVNNGGGVGRLVAHFENKGFAPFEHKAYAPPLPPRPAQTQQSVPRSQLDGLSYLANASSPFVPGRMPAPPAQSPDEGQWGGNFGLQSRMTSPVAAGPFGLDDASRGAGQLTGQYGVIDDFVSAGRLQAPLPPSQGAQSRMLSRPAAAPPAQAGPPPTSGTPGFAIWRPPEAAGIKSEPPQSTGGYGKPPVPKTPKPSVDGSGNQFILDEFKPSAKAKGKAPAKPPRLRVPRPSAAPPFSPEIKQEPATPQAPLLSPPMSALPVSRGCVAGRTASCEPKQTQGGGATSLRSHAAGSRPSREQVPAEAWEQFKSTIRALYLDERRPLKEVMNVMAEKYNFQATPKMYKTRFSQWGFVKNNTEDEVKRLLSMKFQRDAEGKVSEFVRNGRVVNLGTYLKRKGVTEYDLIDFELPADLPAHVKCRTPTPPPTPQHLQSPDLVRAQEIVVGNMRKAFLHCRQVEVESEAQIGWSSTMVWGAGSSDLLMEANFYFEARDADQGGHFLMRAFKQLELDLRKLSPLSINELLQGMVQRDAGMMTALCKYLAAYSTTNLERAHPLRQIFTCLYDVQQKHGPGTLSDLLQDSIPTIAEELEAIYSPRHPYVARAWIDLALFYNHSDPDRLGQLVAEIRGQERQLEQRHGPSSVEVLSLRYCVLQLLYAVAPHSESTKQAATELWNHVKSLGIVFAVRDTKPNVFCYHSLLKVDPWTKRCRRRYDSGVAIMEEHLGVKVLPYFEEDFHTTQHAPDSQQAWSAAVQHMQAGKWAYI